MSFPSKPSGVYGNCHISDSETCFFLGFNLQIQGRIDLSLLHSCFDQATCIWCPCSASMKQSRSTTCMKHIFLVLRVTCLDVKLARFFLNSHQVLLHLTIVAIPHPRAAHCTAHGAENCTIPPARFHPCLVQTKT